MKTASNTNRTEMVKALKELEAKATHADVFFQDERETGELIQISPGCYEGGPDGMEKTGEVLIVKDEKDSEGYPEEHARFERTDDADLYIDLRNAAPWLLQIAEAFQPGDAEMIKSMADRIMGVMLQSDAEKACLRRLQAACEEMER